MSCLLKYVAILAIMVCFPTRDVVGHPDGAPNDMDICNSMIPGHTHSPQVMPAPFEIIVSENSYRAGQTFTVTLRATGSKSFLGFLVKAHRDDPRLDRSEPIGTIQSAEGVQQICSSRWGNAVTHTEAVPRRELTLSWTAPNPPQGHVVFRATFVVSYDEFWVGERSSTVIDEMSPNLPQSTTKRPVSGTSFVPIDLSGCGSTKGCYRNPKGCEEPACDTVVTWRLNNEYVDFELSGDAHGWVAIGFSDDKKMGKDSVTECVRITDDNNRVEVRQSWNNYPGKSNSIMTDPFEGLMNMDGSYSDGRVRCRFSRIKKIDSNNRIYDLSTLGYHLFLAMGNATDSGDKEIHNLEPFKYPFITKNKVSMIDIVDLSGTTRFPLVKIHGILMVIGWMMCASLAIMMARYYKPMWPNDRVCGQRVWFATHRACMLITLVCTVIGFILIFIHAGDYSQMPNLPDKAHPPIGITVTILCILNPLISLCRCSPKSKRRPIFNWIHWFLGTAGFILATVAIMLGMSLPKAHVPWWTTWVLVAFLLFHLIIELLLEIHGCINSRKQKQREMEFEMRKKGDPHGEIHVFEPNPVGTRFKTIIISIYLFVLVVLGIVVIIAIAIG